MPVFFFLLKLKKGHCKQPQNLSATKGKEDNASYEHACNFNLVQRYIHSRTIPEHLPTHFHLLRTVVNTLIYTFY